MEETKKTKETEIKCDFKACGKLLGKGIVMLLVLLFKKHTFKTLFAISVGINIFLMVSCMNAKGERDFNAHKAYILEQKVDSLNIMVGRE